MQELSEWRTGRNFIRPGDEVKVKPGPGIKSSFLARVSRIKADDNGEVTEVEVFSDRGMRTVVPERIVRLEQTKQGETRQRIRDFDLPKAGSHKAGKR